MDVATLRRAMEPTSVSDATLTAYLPHFIEAMRAAEIATVKRGAAWCSQVGHESAGLRYMAEIQTSSPTWSADRTRYRGRGPIQLTWQGNYLRFGQWCHQRGLVDDDALFVNQPELVEQPRWGFLAASWYWLNAGPRPGRINDYADVGDILAVSRCVNGWVDGKQPNGMPDRQARWDRDLAIGDALITDMPTPATPPGENMPLTQGDPTWLYGCLTGDGQIDVRALDGWQTRGHGDFKEVRGIMFHHMGSRGGPEVIRDGRSDLAGPLSQLHISMTGVVTVIAQGVSWHAGTGWLNWIPANMGNWYLIGVECEWPYNSQVTGPGNAYLCPWDPRQIQAMRNVAAAVCRRGNFGVDRVTTHKEYAGAAQGKWDPGYFDPPWFRGEVAKDLAGYQFPGEGSAIYTPTPTPIVVPPPTHTAGILLYRGIQGRDADVRKLQAVLKAKITSKLTVDGDFGPATEASVKAWQGSRYHNPPLVVDGIVGPATAASLGLVL